MNVVQNELYLINKCCNYVKYSIDNYNIYCKTLILTYTPIPKSIFNLDVVILNTIHELTPRLAGQQPTQRSYKINFFFKKNAVSHMTFAGRLAKSARHTVHALFILDLPYLAIRTSLYISIII